MRMRRTAIALALALVAGCRPTAGADGTVTPGSGEGPRVDQTPEGEPEDRSIGAFQKKLEVYRTKKSAIVNASTSDPAVCEELCSLASDICEVKEKLCDLADEHPGDEQYQGLCREAHNECREAQESCVSCVEANR